MQNSTQHRTLAFKILLKQAVNKSVGFWIEEVEVVHTIFLRTYLRLVMGKGKRMGRHCIRYFYGESANAIKIQIWVTLIANLLLMIIQKRIKRPWSFSGLATIIRIMLIYYVNCYTFLEEPEKDWAKMIQEAKEIPPKPSLFD